MPELQGAPARSVQLWDVFAEQSVLVPLTLSRTGAKKERWVKDNQGQMVITAGQIVWTAECERALSEPEGAKKALRLLKKSWVSYLNKLTAVTRSKLSRIERNKASTCCLWCAHLKTNS